MLKVGDTVVCLDIVSHNSSDKLTVEELTKYKTYTIKIFYNRKNM